LKQLQYNIRHRLFITACIIVLCCLPVAAQYLRNGALDGPVTGNNNPPDYWGVCDIFSTPELRDTFIRTPDTFISPDLSKFSILRLRGLNNDPSGTGEHLFTKLITPLERGYCYEFSAWLLHTYNGSWGSPTEPVKLQLWGGLDSCSMDEMLYESELIITNDSWREFKFYFVVENNDYPWFYIRPYWDFENVSGDYYEGVIMMDNLAIQQIKTIETLLVDTIYYSIDPPNPLQAEEGISYSWSPPDVVSDAFLRDPILLDYTEMLSVVIQDRDYCPIRERFIVILDCDSLYKNEIWNEHKVFYSLQHDVTLTAAEGYSYLWEPQVNLSAYTIQNPILTDYQESFRVRVEDKFGCFFNELFNILGDCDTLYPQKSYYTLDTVIHQGEELILKPSYGNPSNTWSPMIGLSCVECRNPEAYPTSSTLYRVELSDQFNCTHEELFSIEVILEVPNVITPNGDGYNDKFVIRGLPPGSSLHIYRKDGRLLYSNTNYGYPEWWTGMDSKGGMIPSGSYWYILEIPSLSIVKKDFIFVKR
jgi:gliding motility-associated-like protein